MTQEADTAVPVMVLSSKCYAVCILYVINRCVVEWAGVTRIDPARLTHSKCFSFSGRPGKKSDRVLGGNGTTSTVPTRAFILIKV